MTACSPLISFAVSPRSAGHHAPLAERPETCACDFTDVFAVRQPTISQHLKVLREAGLVHTRRCGTQICYSIDAPSAIQKIVHTIMPAVNARARNRLSTTSGDPTLLVRHRS